MTGTDLLVVAVLVAIVVTGVIIDRIRTLDRRQAQRGVADHQGISPRARRATPHYDDHDLAGQLEQDRRRSRRQP